MKYNIRNIVWIALFLIIGCDSQTVSEDVLNDTFLEIGSVTLSDSEIKAHMMKVKENHQPRSGEMHFHEILEKVPGFGGYFVDESGTPVIYLKQGANEGLSRTLAARQMRSLNITEFEGLESATIEIREADFDFEELALWRELIFEFVLGSDTFEYVITLHVDETRNRVSVGIDENRYTGENVSHLKDFLASELEIPSDAVIYKKTAPIERNKKVTKKLPMYSLSGSLTQHNRPIVGGLLIRNQDGGGCTGGFIANTFPTKIMITNSHCTTTLFQNDEKLFYQPSNYFTAFGREHKDPNAWVCGFNQFCRNSDAAAVRMFDSEDFKVGQIAKTTWLNNSGGAGSTTIDSSSPVFSIVEDGNFSISGTNVEKVGKESGWTGGNIVGTCIDTVMNPPNYKLICQHHADFYAEGGDSGSAVFQRLDSIHVRLVGLLWGKSGNTVFFSRMKGIRDDLGNFSALDPDSGYNPPDDPDDPNDPGDPIP